jgi:multidrug resistance efflux pump
MMVVLNATETPMRRTEISMEALLELIRRARTAETIAAVRFIAVNDTHLLAPFDQSALWLRHHGVQALSGLVEIEANAPYTRWIEAVARELSKTPARTVTASDLSPNLAEEWIHWLPANVAWIPFGAKQSVGGGLLLARHLPWQEQEIQMLSEWMETWCCAYRALSKPSALASLLRLRFFKVGKLAAQKPLVPIAAVLLLAAIPVRLSVLAPGELVPANPVPIRAPLEGVIKTFYVTTNQPVKADQPLFAYDDASLVSKIDVATEALRTSEAEHRQLSQMALSDPKARAALAAAKGQVEERRIDLEFLQSQLARNRVVAPRDGIAFVDDPSEWLGRQVVPGQRIMRLAEPADREIEAWLPVGDAIDLGEGSPVRLYLASDPLKPVAGHVRAVSYEPQQRPDGSYAYRIRARLDGESTHRIGLKGTARLSGSRVPLGYWIMRRPFAAARQFLGI